MPLTGSGSLGTPAGKFYQVYSTYSADAIWRIIPGAAVQFQDACSYVR